MKLPCSQCRERGRAESCAIAPVVVKGRLIVNGDNKAEPSYAEICEENKRLREALLQQTTGLRGPPAPRLQAIAAPESILYSRLKSHHRPSTVKSASDVEFPSDLCSTSLVKHGVRWTLWQHYAVIPEKFAEEHHNFLLACRHIRPEEAAEPQWLAIYFACLTASLLFMTDEEATRAGIDQYGGAATVLTNWFDAAYYFLQRGDFLRKPDIRNVEAIAVIGVSSSHFGEFILYYHLWSCAVRTCQLLGINSEPGSANLSPAERQHRKSLWWTFVVDDWLSSSLGQTFIDETQFSVGPPEDVADDGKVHPVQYRIALIKICTALRRFQKSLAFTGNDLNALEVTVKMADNELAHIISTLPNHLQPGDEESQGIDVDERIGCNGQRPEWAIWQRKNIAAVLLYYRMVVYRCVRDIAPRTSSSYTSASAICLASAHGIAENAAVDTDGLAFRHFTWFHLLPLFSATANLIEFSQDCRCGSAKRHNECIKRCSSHFEQIAHRSIYAAHASRVLSEMHNGIAT
ncbi:hypothetical protein BX600DRAFT_552817 [Xylariales sp. PMI_506]|nr:hypothetical protein BX600DRAFT_552817 [Xylariales sp. PMI_506]